MNIRREQFLAAQQQAKAKDRDVALWVAAEKFRRGHVAP